MINIEDLIPLLRKGYVAMDKDGRWTWYKEKPIQISECYVCNPKCLEFCVLYVFDITPAKYWKKSLRKVG